MNSNTCDKCDSSPSSDFQFEDRQFDFCWKCGQDLCLDCMKKGCCEKIPALSGTLTANFLHVTFGNNSPEWALSIEIRTKEDVNTLQNRILKCDDCGSLTLPGKYIELKNGQIICTECHPA